MREKILIVADDFTGALDTATQFAKCGISTVTISSPDAFLAMEEWPSEQLCAISTNTRHMEACSAYSIVKNTVKKAISLGVDGVYKKVDSALRGNIGKEIDAVLDVISAPMLLAPAYPENGRTTRNGIQFVNSVPIHETAYGLDPFEPIHTSSISEILGGQSKYPMQSLAPTDIPNVLLANRTVYIVDATKKADLAVVARLIKRKKPWILSGSAGLAAAVAAEMEAQRPEADYDIEPSMLMVISGSVSPISNQQIQNVQEKGTYVLSLYESDIPNVLEGGEDYQKQVRLWQNTLQKEHFLILKAAGCGGDGRPLPPKDMAEGRERMADALAAVARDIISRFEQCSMFVIGGDTLQAISSTMFSEKLYPMRELEVGIPLSVARDVNGREISVISKSGSFGDEHLLERIMNKVLKGVKL